MVLPAHGVGAIYNPDALSARARCSLVHARGTRRLPIALRLRFATQASEVPLHVFLVHWPSRVRSHQVQQRKALGHELQRKVDALRRGGGAPPAVIVMGDFNDEPFDESMSDGLLGSRDRTLARSNKGRLYNPFWRLLGEKQTLEEEAEAPGRLGAGTCFYRSDGSTHWYTYDQILVSSSFLAGDGWLLREQDTRVWQQPPLLTDRGRLARDFDHLPVVGALTHGISTVTSPGD